MSLELLLFWALVARVVCLIAVGLVWWKADVIVNRLGGESAWLFCLAAVLLYVGALAMGVWLLAGQPVPWPLPIFMGGVVLYLLADRRGIARSAPAKQPEVMQ